jgi:hypothetical protein
MGTMHKFFGLVGTAVLAAALVVPAQADHIHEGDSFYGGWSMSNRTQGNMVIGDGNGWGLSLGTTERYCGRPGVGYSKMRNFIKSNYPDWVSWYVDEVCDDGYVRICVYSAGGSQACSTYVDWGWVPL